MGGRSRGLEGEEVEEGGREKRGKERRVGRRGGVMEVMK